MILNPSKFLESLILFSSSFQSRVLILLSNRVSKKKELLKQLKLKLKSKTYLIPSNSYQNGEPGQIQHDPLPRHRQQSSRLRREPHRLRSFPRLGRRAPEPTSRPRRRRHAALHGYWTSSTKVQIPRPDIIRWRWDVCVISQANFSSSRILELYYYR